MMTRLLDPPGGGVALTRDPDFNARQYVTFGRLKLIISRISIPYIIIGWSLKTKLNFFPVPFNFLVPYGEKITHVEFHVI